MEPPTPYKGDFLDGLLVQMETDLQQGLLKEWVPVKALHTEEDRLFHGNQWSGLFRLPAPFFMQAQEPLGIRLQVRDDVPDFKIDGLRSQIDVHLRGKDPMTGVPCSYGKRITTPTRAGLPFTYRMDEDRDAPIRDIIVTEIGFGAVDTFMPGVAKAGWMGFDPLEIKFMPATGPDWTKDLFTHLGQGLLEDVGSGLYRGPRFFLRHPVIHKPKRPYILRPGDSIRIEAMYCEGDENTLPPNAYCGSKEEPAQNLIFCRVSGVQEGTNA
jgi:hypothetical protein